MAKNPLWLTPRTSHIRLTGKLAFSLSMKANLIRDLLRAARRVCMAGSIAALDTGAISGHPVADHLRDRHGRGEGRARLQPVR